MWNTKPLCIYFLLLISGTVLTDESIDEVPDIAPEVVHYEPVEALPRYKHPHHNEDGVIEWMPRIIGGTRAQIGEFPGKVSIQVPSGAHFCGGTLIDMTTVLTAAHCVTSERGEVMNPSAIRVMGDDLSITQLASRSRQVREVTHIFVHPNYSAWTMANDIAVLRVGVPFSRTSVFYHMEMNLVLPPPDTTCHLAGWGLTAENDNRPNPELMRVDLQIISTAVCNGNQSYNGLIQQGQFCAGTMAGGRDACQGDSGGALLCHGMVTGIVSFGYGCGRPRFPGVYIDVSQYLDWIRLAISWSGPHDDIPRPTTTDNPNDSPKMVLSVFTVYALYLVLITKFLRL